MISAGRKERLAPERRVVYAQRVAEDTSGRRGTGEGKGNGRISKEKEKEKEKEILTSGSGCEVAQ